MHPELFSTLSMLVDNEIFQDYRVKDGAFREGMGWSFIWFYDQTN